MSKRSTERVEELLHGRVALDVRGVDEFGRLLANIRLSDARDTGADCTSLFRPSVARLFRLRRWPYWTITSYLQLPLLDGFCENDEWAAAFDLVAIESPIISSQVVELH